MKFDINSKNENMFGTSTGNTGFNGSANNLGTGFKGTKLAAGLNTGGLNTGLKGRFSSLKNTSGETSFKKELTKARAKETVEPVHIEKIDTVKVERNDAQFFLNLIENKSIAVETAENQKSANVSKTLMDLLHKANDTKKPVRIDFDNKITLILRIEQDGKLNAQFFPGDKVAEEYLKNNIPFLRQQFEEKEIKYSSLNHHSQRDKKEKKHE